MRERSVGRAAVLGAQLKYDELAVNEATTSSVAEVAREPVQVRLCRPTTPFHYNSKRIDLAIYLSSSNYGPF
jgi:hypothetical protein